jgi:hypothetical protein
MRGRDLGTRGWLRWETTGGQWGQERSTKLLIKWTDQLALVKKALVRKAKVQKRRDEKSKKLDVSFECVFPCLTCNERRR